jgi:hypothetical protein
MAEIWRNSGSAPAQELTTRLEDLVKLVDKNLLNVNPGDRLEAAGLHEQLQAIFERAQNDRSYLMKVADHPPAIPPIFSQQSLHSSPESTIQNAIQ